MIHRVVYGSIERFIGILIENYAGAFPAWLAPEQVRVMPITDKFNEYAKSVVDKMEALGIRAHLDDRNEKIGYKIREGQVKKVPYMLVVGEKEATMVRCPSAAAAKARWERWLLMNSLPNSRRKSRRKNKLTDCSICSRISE